MRVLFCSTGGSGHIQPMRPLAAALQRLGHSVGWATAPDALPGLAGQAMTLFPAGPTFEAGRRQFRESHPEIQGLRGERLSEQTFPGLFGDTLAPAMLEDVDAAIAGWQPDLVVVEPAALAAPLVCHLHAVPYATHGLGLPVPAVRIKSAMHRFGREWEARGLEVPPDGGLYRHLYIDIAPGSLVPPADRPAAPTLALNPYAVTATDGAALPEDLRAALADPGRPRVYLTFGTVFHRQPALALAAQSLVDLGAEVVVTLGPDSDCSGWGPAQPSLHLRRFVDQAQLFPHCDAVVSHGGAGTVLGAAAHGRPQLILPQAADHFRNARALSAASAAIVIEPESQTADVIRLQAERLLASARHAEAAVRLAGELGAMPVADDTADSLVAIVTSGEAFKSNRKRCF